MIKQILGKYSLNYCVNSSLKRISYIKYSIEILLKSVCSCMRNMDSIISAHNQRLLTPNNSSFGCNCRNESNCPLKEKCLTPKVIYQANVTYDVDEEYKFYYSLTGTSFKEKFRNHTISSTIQKQNSIV